VSLTRGSSRARPMSVIRLTRLISSTTDPSMVPKPALTLATTGVIAARRTWTQKVCRCVSPLARAVWL
jgi:hypothetical protein